MIVPLAISYGFKSITLSDLTKYVFHRDPRSLSRVKIANCCGEAAAVVSLASSTSLVRQLLYHFYIHSTGSRVSTNMMDWKISLN